LISKNTPVLITANDDGKLFDQILEHLPFVDLIKFTGGEPLMMKEFYDILDILIQQNRNEVELFYNTNLTITHYKGRSIFDLWQNFKKITVGASLDAEGVRGEYIRAGSKWHEIVKNREDMLKCCPEVDFFVSVTVNILNAWHLPDFHKSWVEKGLIRPQEFDVSLLTGPAYLRLHRAPDRLKRELKDKYQEHLEWLRSRDTTGRSVLAFESLLALADVEEEFDAQDFWKNTSKLDLYHKTDLLSVFPELQCLPKVDQ
jgi:sulfatase maturation enzyme AslB (radical SAM superfamily)